MILPVTVGTEWLVEAYGCDAERLRSLSALKSVFEELMSDLELKPVEQPIWHKFPGEGGVTGLVALTESHLACHTYPEHRIATFNLYCCKERPEWEWSRQLEEMIGSLRVKVTRIDRGIGDETSAAGGAG